MPANVAHPFHESLDSHLRHSGHDQVVQTERSQRSTAQPNDVPTDLGEQLVFAPVCTLTAADVLVAVSADRVKLNSDGQFGNNDVGPHLNPTEERRTNAHSVRREVDVEPLADKHPQSALGRRGRARRTLAAKRLARSNRLG